MSVAWLIRRLHPREGWDLFLLMTMAVVCLPATFVMAEWVPYDDSLIPLAFVAFLVGRWLTLDQDTGTGSWLLALIPGCLAAFNVASHTLMLLPGSGDRLIDFAQRWHLWLQAALSGGTNADPDIFLFYAALLCWVLILFSAWAFYRQQNALLALLAIVLPGAVSVYYSEKGSIWLILQLGVGVLVLALGHLARARRSWEEAGVDYATELKSELVMSATLTAIAVMTLGFAGPEFSIRRISDWFWRTFRKPAAQTEETMERLFGGVAPASGGPYLGEGAGGSSYLPQSHLLGGRPDLLEQVAMEVRTDEPPPLPPDLPVMIPEELAGAETAPHYWRGGSYDYYTGRGWQMSIEERHKVEGTLPLSSPPAYREVTQHYTLTLPHGDTLYALNMPVWVDRPVEALWRTPDDLVGLASETTIYTVISRLPTPTARELRSAPATYPDEIGARYLQLPPELPRRVVDLAHQVVGGADAVYDQARLLERYLRQYTYSLEVERPPEGWDVADYFLFEIQKGHCDYYATAFVVMARAVGIPARLASGYVGGEYDFTRGVYLVRQLNGHSWPEVYFPGWGWIGFEPTAARPVTEFPEDHILPASGETSSLETPPTPGKLSLWWAVGAGAVAIAIAVSWVLLRYRYRQAGRRLTLPLLWRRVQRSGARMGLPSNPALTPHEYATALAGEMRIRAERMRRRRWRWIGLATQAGQA
ncbi:MAG: transglutaminase domain-containing protein, partial [Anaerolineae bacterium]|nr:transglutaminase domain-containing protein [Anaerolineae bacterium]